MSNELIIRQIKTKTRKTYESDKQYFLVWERPQIDRIDAKGKDPIYIGTDAYDLSKFIERYYEENENKVEERADTPTQPNDDIPF